MIVSVNWLKKFVKINLPIEELAKQIGSKLVEVEGVTDLGQKYRDVLIVKVVKCDKHADSDHLSVAYIDDGGVTGDAWRGDDGLIQVVCGAPNIRAGLTVAWLPPESIVPETADDAEPFQLSVRKLRGVLSHGMIASPRELDLWDEHEGILEITDDFPAGARFAQSYELDDYLLEIENKSLTHRPDCFGMVGFAREVAGILGQKFTSPQWFNYQLKFKAQTSEIAVAIDDSKLSTKFQASLVANVREATGLSFLQKTYLARVGVRPIEPVVDISNWVMLEMGQPTHAYDYDKLLKITKEQGLDQICLTVRAGHQGENLTLLDGKRVELSPDDTVIAVGEHAVALAGVMGGFDTKIDKSTERIVLESASFNLYKMRSAQMRHGIFSEALTRFTKGQPSAITDIALGRNLALLTGIDDAHKLFAVATAEMKTNSRTEIALNYQLINNYLGTNFNANILKTILENVELEVKIKGDDLVVQVPWWRTDVTRRVEVIEEIGRLNGYDNLELTLPRRAISANLISSFDNLRQSLRQILASGGLNEVLTYNFVPEKLITKAGQNPDNSYRLVNSISPELERYRQAILPNLLDKVYPNIRAGFEQFGLFELGKIHWKSHGLEDDGTPFEMNSLALVLADKKSNQTGFYLAKKYAELIADKLHVCFDYRPLKSDLPTATVFEPKRSAEIWLNGQLIGFVGEFKKAIRTNFKLPKLVAGLEIDLQALAEQQTTAQIQFKPIKTLPSVSRDLCLEVAREVNYQTIIEILTQATEKFKAIEFELAPVDFYQKDDDLKRITVRLTLTPSDKTLVSKQVDAIVDQLTKALATKLKFKII